MMPRCDFGGTCRTLRRICSIPPLMVAPAARRQHLRRIAQAAVVLPGFSDRPTAVAILPHSPGTGRGIRRGDGSRLRCRERCHSHSRNVCERHLARQYRLRNCDSWSPSRVCLSSTPSRLKALLHAGGNLRQSRPHETLVSREGRGRQDEPTTHCIKDPETASERSRQLDALKMVLTAPLLGTS